MNTCGEHVSAAELSAPKSGPRPVGHEVKMRVCPLRRENARKKHLKQVLIFFFSPPEGTDGACSL